MSKNAAAPEVTSPEPEVNSPTTPPWLWTIVGVIVLVALAGGGIAGFEFGRQYEREHSTGSCAYQDTYWLLGASLVDRSQEVYWENIAVDGPADTAGIKEGDRLVAIDGEAINTSRQARNILKGYSVGEQVNLTVERKNRFEQYYIILGHIYPCPVAPTYPPVIIAPPPQPPDTYEDARLGVYYRTIQSDDPFAVNNGALIITVWSDSPAENAGLEAADIITKVGSRSLTRSYTLADALDRYSVGDRVSLSVWDHRTGNIVKLSVRLNSQ
ncbi:MAG: PDZ domain-containing protein [Anaerolineae bacterium]|nr:PDZ domain-containing protein [Anaerolineae bacterium]